MAVSVYQYPTGFVLNATEQTIEIIGTPANAIVILTSHGASNGAYVYIKTPVENYNGLKRIFVINVNSFLICDPVEDYSNHAIPYISDTTGILRSLDSLPDWHCLHLPIVYKLSNTLWPTNSVDTVRAMTVTSSNGYCAIAASGGIKATGSAAKLEFVKVTNAGDYNGIYQIISYTNDTTFTIDLVYSSDADTALTAGNIQYYYNNYVTKVEVWAGLNVEHEFYSVEPYELLGTLDLIPDENNICKFSISDILKQNIAVRNNLLLGTLPNNLDAFTKFFIKYGEEYDDSDGTTLSRSTVSYTSDYSSFQGYAVNAKLPFKNVYSGALSEYVSGDSNQKFLTDFARPTIFNGKYFDLSFISQLYMGSVADVRNGDFPSILAPWENTGSGQNWAHNTIPDRAEVTVTSPQESKRLEQYYDVKSGYTYLIKFDETIGTFDNTYSVTCYFTNDAYSSSQTITTNAVVGNGTNTRNAIITADSNYTKIVFEVTLP